MDNKKVFEVTKNIYDLKQIPRSHPSTAILMVASIIFSFWLSYIQAMEGPMENPAHPSPNSSSTRPDSSTCSIRQEIATVPKSPITGPQEIHNKKQGSRHPSIKSNQEGEKNLPSPMSLGKPQKVEEDQLPHAPQAKVNKVTARDYYDKGCNFREGRGVSQDDEKAFKCYKKAALKKYALAQHQIGMYYSQGYGGVGKNEVKARKWFKRAAKQSHKASIQELEKLKQQQEANKLYNELIEEGRKHQALGENGKLIDHTKLNPRMLYLLIEAREKGHTESKKLLEEIILEKLKVRVHKWKIGPFAPKKEAFFKEYDDLSADQKEEFSNKYRHAFQQILHSLEIEREKHCKACEGLSKKLKEIKDEEAVIEKELSSFYQGASDLLKSGVAHDISEYIPYLSGSKYIQYQGLVERQAKLKIEEKAALGNFRQTVFGSMPPTKTEIFKTRVKNKLLLKFIARIAIAAGEADRSADGVDHLIDVTRSVSTIALGLIPQGGTIAALVTDLTGGVIGASYDAYQKWKIERCIECILGNEDAENTLSNLINGLIPTTVGLLAERYKNPIVMFKASAEEVEKLADYTVKLMMKGTSKRDVQHLKRGDSKFHDLAEFLCDSISYCDKAGILSALASNTIIFIQNNGESHNILTASGVEIPHLNPSKKFYVREYQQNIKDKAQQVADVDKPHNEALKYGFRHEAKTSDDLKVRSFQSLRKNFIFDANGIIELGNDGRNNFVYQKEKNEEAKWKKVGEDLFKNIFTIFWDELPEIIKVAKGT